YSIPTKEITPEVKMDLKILKLRNALDPKRFYKTNDESKLPERFEFGTVVEKAIRFLVSAQEPNGHFRGRDGHDYTQPIAAYALAEAYGMTKVPMVKEAAIKAIRTVATGQNPTGSFNYNLKPSDRDDLSYAAWCVQALKAATIAGLEKDVPEIKLAMQRSIAGVKGHFRASGDAGVFGYSRGGGGRPGLTGAGVLCLQFLGDAKSNEVRRGLAGLASYPFDWENPAAGSIVYYWYYNTQAYFQEGGKMWDDWNAQFSRPLAAVQNVISKEASGYVDHKGVPHEIGFWVSPAPREHTGGNGEVMDTILCTLMLEVYYRYLPTFQQIPQEVIEQELGGDEDDLVIRIVQTRPEIRDLDAAQLLVAANP
ncbi:MAG: prenyltransferase/squalene oxidase repeat-containing protein, partial [Kiritimatiellia bacterium]